VQILAAKHQEVHFRFALKMLNKQIGWTVGGRFSRTISSDPIIEVILLILYILILILP